MSGAARRVREAVSGSPFLTQTTQSGWTVAQKAMRGRKLKAYFAANPRVRLMIGSGPSKLDGWLATDLIPSRPDVVFLDANDPFPFDDATVDRIHTEHMIEHVENELYDPLDEIMQVMRGANDKLIEALRLNREFRKTCADKLDFNV